MPIYEYKCKKCDKTFDIMHGFDEPSTRECLHCQGEAVRVFQANPVVFKGSGFYKTDYKNAPAKTKSKQKKKKEPSDKKSEKKTPEAASKTASS